MTKSIRQSLARINQLLEELANVIMSEQTITIELKVGFANEQRRQAVIQVAQRVATELFANTMLVVANDRLGKPKIKVTVNNFYDDELVVPLLGLDEAPAEDPFTM
jgi:hypothetical protein